MGDPKPLGALRIGTDGRYGMGLVECAHRTVAIHGLSAITIKIDELDYVLAEITPTEPLREHVTASPSCRRVRVEWRPALRGNKVERLRWTTGIIACVMEPEA
jgi:hypothetical protein